MAEYRLQASDYPSTYEYHRDRERARHLEEPWQAPRLYKAVELIRVAEPSNVVDLGCGDGGLLSLLGDIPAWGYDFAPANAEGWTERGVRGELRDVFNERPDNLAWAELVVMTEVIEHLADPHGALKWVASHEQVKYVVASSPDDERPGSTCDSHIYGWDFRGYESLFVEAGFEVVEHVKVDWSQVVLARKVASG